MRRRCWGLAVGCLLGLAGPALAAPTIRYNFTGVLDRPVAGSTQFSGSFSLPGDLLGVDGPSYGAGVSNGLGMSIQIGDHAAATTLVSFGQDPAIDGHLTFDYNASNRPGDVFNLWTVDAQNQADRAALGSRLGLGIYLAQPAGTALAETWPDVLTGLDLGKFSTRAFNLGGSYDQGGGAPTGGIAGTLTSLTPDGDPVVIIPPPSPPAGAVPDPTPTPEPSTLALAGLVGLGWLARRGRRRPA